MIWLFFPSPAPLLKCPSSGAPTVRDRPVSLSNSVLTTEPFPYGKAQDSSLNMMTAKINKLMVFSILCSCAHLYEHTTHTELLVYCTYRCILASGGRVPDCLTQGRVNRLNSVRKVSIASLWRASTYWWSLHRDLPIKINLRIPPLAAFSPTAFAPTVSFTSSLMLASFWPIDTDVTRGCTLFQTLVQVSWIMCQSCMTSHARSPSLTAP